MNAIFRETEKPELFSPRNGMIIFGQIEAQFDSGRLVVVPKLLEKRIGDYIVMIKIIDSTWDKIDAEVTRSSPLITWSFPLLRTDPPEDLRRSKAFAQFRHSTT